MVFIIRKYRTVRFTEQGNMKVVLCVVTRYKYSVEHRHRRFGVHCFVGLQCRKLYRVITRHRLTKDCIRDTQFRRNPNRKEISVQMHYLWSIEGPSSILYCLVPNDRDCCVVLFIVLCCSVYCVVLCVVCVNCVVLCTACV